MAQMASEDTRQQESPEKKQDEAVEEQIQKPAEKGVNIAVGLKAEDQKTEVNEETHKSEVCDSAAPFYDGIACISCP